jgi:hypothetical protein
MEIYSAAECQQRNITVYVICGEWESQQKERCKQKHVCVSDDDDDNYNNSTVDVQRIGFWNVGWTLYSQDRIQDREYVNDVMNRLCMIVQSNITFY